MPSRFSVSASKKTSLSLDKEKRVLQTIEQRKDEVVEEKMVLEDTIRMLQEKVAREKNNLYAVEGRVCRVRQELSRVEVTGKEKSLGVRVSRKKSESFLIEARNLEERIVETVKGNDLLL